MQLYSNLVANIILVSHYVCTKLTLFVVWLAYYDTGPPRGLLSCTSKWTK